MFKTLFRRLGVRWWTLCCRAEIRFFRWRKRVAKKCFILRCRTSDLFENAWYRPSWWFWRHIYSQTPVRRIHLQEAWSDFYIAQIQYSQNLDIIKEAHCKELAKQERAIASLKDRHEKQLARLGNDVKTIIERTTDVRLDRDSERYHVGIDLDARVMCPTLTPWSDREWECLAHEAGWRVEEEILRTKFVRPAQPVRPSHRFVYEDRFHDGKIL
jgi:hypothetical protein